MQQTCFRHCDDPLMLIATLWISSFFSIIPTSSEHLPWLHLCIHPQWAVFSLHPLIPCSDWLFLSISPSQLPFATVALPRLFRALVIPHSPFVEVSRVRVTMKPPPLHVLYSSQVTQRNDVQLFWGRRWTQKPQWKAAFNVLSCCVWVPSKCSLYRELAGGHGATVRHAALSLPFRFPDSVKTDTPTPTGNVWFWFSEPLLTLVGPNDPFNQNMGAHLTSTGRLSRLCCRLGVMKRCRIQTVFICDFKKLHYTIHGEWCYCV